MTDQKSHLFPKQSITSSGIWASCFSIGQSINKELFGGTNKAHMRDVSADNPITKTLYANPFD